MCDLKGLKATGIVFAIFATLVSLGTEGFYAWETYQVDHQCYNQTMSDVCDYDELETRTYIGLAEGILGTIISIFLIVGFALPYTPLIWTWVVWALGISAYNAYCIYDYYTVIEDNNSGGSFPWDDLVTQDYSYFLICVIASVCCHVFTLIFIIPLGAAITHMYVRGKVASFKLDNYQWDNDAFAMD
nr:uncharacterized protein LOC128694283 isoform X1 [Cherax quadricarinatus]